MYVVPRKDGRFELRESRLTAKGPRSITLASFKELTPEAIERASTRSGARLDPAALRRAALRAGAPVAPPEADRAAGELLRELALGHRPRPGLERLLREALAGEGRRPAGSAEGAAAWIGATPQRRGEALRDLLLLADALPHRKRGARERFPRIESSPA